MIDCDWYPVNERTYREYSRISRIYQMMWWNLLHLPLSILYTDE